MPIGLLLRLGAILVVIVSIAGGWFALKQHYRHQGAAEVQEKWDKERIAQELAKESQERAWAAEARNASVSVKQRNTARSAAFRALRERDALAAEVASLRVPAAAVGKLRDATDEANAARPTAGTGGSPARVAAPAGDTTLGALVDWFSKVAEVHAECRDRVMGWIAFYRGLQEAQKQ